MFPLVLDHCAGQGHAVAAHCAPLHSGGSPHKHVKYIQAIFFSVDFMALQDHCAAMVVPNITTTTTVTAQCSMS